MNIPVIASLNGVSTGGWIDYAKKIEQAGADALELNIYYIPTDPDMTGAQVEQMYADLVRDVQGQRQDPGGGEARPVLQLHRQHGPAAGRGRRRRPGALQPLLPAGLRPGDAGGDAQPGPQHGPTSCCCACSWVAILYGRVKADLAITGGVHTAEDVLKSMMAGAKVAMMTSALLRNGIEHIGDGAGRT